MTLKANLWLIAMKAELIKKLSSEIDAISHELGDKHEVFDPSDMNWDHAEVISGAMLDEEHLYVVRDGKRENLAKNERQTAKLYEYDEDDNEKIVNSNYIRRKKKWKRTEKRTKSRKQRQRGNFRRLSTQPFPVCGCQALTRDCDLPEVSTAIPKRKAVER